MGYGNIRTMVALVSLAGSALVGPTAWARSCDDSCLKGILHQYLDQLPKHDAGPLAVSAQLNARENTEPVKLGDGSWKTITAVLPGLEFADPVAGQVIYAGGVRRDGALGTMFLRLKVVDGKITESEMLTTGAGALIPARPAGSAQAGGPPARARDRRRRRICRPCCTPTLSTTPSYPRTGARPVNS